MAAAACSPTCLDYSRNYSAILANGDISNICTS
jgi:hypothetical protein